MVAEWRTSVSEVLGLLILLLLTPPALTRSYAKGSYAEVVLEIKDATPSNVTLLITNATVSSSAIENYSTTTGPINTTTVDEDEASNFEANDTTTGAKPIFPKVHFTNFVTVKTEASDEAEQDVTTSAFSTSPTTPVPTTPTTHAVPTLLPASGIPTAIPLNESFPSKFEPVIKQPVAPYLGSQFPSKPVRLEPAPVTEEVEDFSPFEANKQSILQWIASLLANYGFGSDQSTVAPEPIDQSKCKPCGCGLTNKKNRIVGGKETQVNEYPWMCLLTYHGEFYCGGTLINHRYVLTAAHCVSGFRASRIRVRLLEHNQKLDNETTLIERGVAKVIKHAGYSTVTLDNDIALIKLDKDVEIEDEVRPVCLPVPKKSFSGETGIVTGWGVTSAGKIREGDDIRAHISPVLQELQVPVMSNDECRMTGYMKNQITDNMLCAGYKEGGKDSCQGDSGGPLHVADGDYHHIVGVVSWGQGCARPNFPGVYSRVNRYLPWILKYTADACPCNEIGDPEPVVAEEESPEEPDKEDGNSGGEMTETKL